MTRQQKLTLVATILGSGAVILDGTVVNLALPKVASDLHAGFADLQWIVDGYLLTLSALMLLGGSLGDIFGRKRIYLTGLVGFGITSLLCGLAVSPEMLVITRLLQGCFGALLVPGALAIINTNFSARERGKAIGSWSAWLSIAPAVGPLLGGYVLEIASWRWIFFINLPLVVACYLMAVPGFKESRDENPRKVDVPGALLAMLSLGGITYGLIEGPARHWNAAALTPLIIGILLGAAFMYVERHAKDPMVEFAVFKSRNFTVSNLMTFGLYGALGGFLFAFAIYLQTRLHYSPVAAGASSLPIPFLLFFLSSWMGNKANLYGPKLFMTVGPILVALGMLLLLPLEPGASYITGILPGIVLFALGLSTTVAPLTITVMASVNDRMSGIASGINNAVSRVSGLLVVAVLGLFGTAHVYRFALVLSAVLAVAAGVISFIFIENRAVAAQTDAPAAK